MSKIDRIKEELAWLKVVFGVFAVTDVSLVAWLAQNYARDSVILMVFGFIGVVLATAIVVWVNRAAIKRFKQLEKE